MIAQHLLGKRKTDDLIVYLCALLYRLGGTVVLRVPDFQFRFMPGIRVLRSKAHTHLSIVESQKQPMKAGELYTLGHDLEQDTTIYLACILKRFGGKCLVAHDQMVFPEVAMTYVSHKFVDRIELYLRDSQGQPITPKNKDARATLAPALPADDHQGVIIRGQS